MYGYFSHSKYFCLIQGAGKEWEGFDCMMDESYRLEEGEKGAGKEKEGVESMQSGTYAKWNQWDKGAGKEWMKNLCTSKMNKLNANEELFRNSEKNIILVK